LVESERRLVCWSVNNMTHCQTPQIQMENHLPMSPPPPPISWKLCVEAHGHIDSPPVQDVHSSLPSLSLSPIECGDTQSQAPFTPRNLMDTRLGYYPQTSKLSTREGRAKNHIPSFLPIRLSVLSNMKSNNNRPSLLDFEEQAINFLLQSRATKIALRPRPRILITPESTTEMERGQPAIEKDITEFIPPLPLIDTPQIFQTIARSA